MTGGLLTIVGRRVLLRDPRPEDVEARLRWSTVETEWQNWDAPWEGPPPTPVGELTEARVKKCAASIAADIADTEQRLEEIRMQEAAADARQLRQLEAERKMLEVRLENSRRELLYSEYGATKRTLLQQQQSAREMTFQTRDDPFAFAQAQGAFPMIGGTPAQAFRGNLMGFANAPIPQMSINTPIPMMEQMLSQMGGLQMPIPSPYVGMAQGGVVGTQDDIFGVKPLAGRKVTHLVGDGAGIIPGITEAQTIEFGPSGIKSVEVTPLAGGAQAGMTVNPEAMKAMLAPLFADISPGGYPMAGYGQRASWLGEFGYQPSFVRHGPRFYLRSPEGTYREIAPSFVPGWLGQEGMANVPPFESAVRLMSGELSRLGPVGPGLSTAELPGFLKSLSGPQSVGAFGPMSGLISEPTTGIMMPAPYQVAQELQRLRYENPTLFEGILSAYRNAYIGGQPAGFSREALLNQIGAATPQARYAGYTPQRIGFTGANY